MARDVTHKPIVKLHKDISQYHNSINGFYRFNWNEINGMLRNGVGVPVLLLESHSAKLETSPNKATTFNDRAISFLVLDNTSRPDAYDEQETVLDATENICIDIASYLKKLNDDRTSPWFGKFEASSYTYEKVGPIFGNMYGWNVTYILTNHESLCFDADKWTIPPSP